MLVLQNLEKQGVLGGILAPKIPSLRACCLMCHILGSENAVLVIFEGFYLLFLIFFLKKNPKKYHEILFKYTLYNIFVNISWKLRP